MTLNNDLINDLPEFLDTDEFADSAIIGVGQTYETTINGIFDNEHLLVEGGEVGVSGTVPMFLCRTSDVTSIVYGDVVTIDSNDYKVVDQQPDGTGMTLLILEAQ